MDSLFIYTAYDRQGRFLGVCTAASDGMCIRENLYQICNAMRIPESDVEFYRVGTLEIDIPLAKANEYEGDERLRFLDQSKSFTLLPTKQKLVPHSAYKFPETYGRPMSEQQFKEKIADLQNNSSSRSMSDSLSVSNS